MESQTFTIAPDAFDVTLLPSEARTPGIAVFGEAVNAFLREAFRGFGGRVTILVDDRRIAVSWNPDPTPSSPLEVIAGKLREGRTAEGIQLLRLVLSRQPDDVNVLYNLGVALSDAGRLDEAVAHLRRAVELAPAFGNGLVALGVALSRQQKNVEAVEVLEVAVKRVGFSDRLLGNRRDRMSLGVSHLFRGQVRMKTVTGVFCFGNPMARR
jgi:tetratricopeptide (TPR) repeat protein